MILDHINGVSDDHRLENLRIVCPNCAATLDTHCARGRRITRSEQTCMRCRGTFRPKTASQRYCSARVRDSVGPVRPCAAGRAARRSASVPAVGPRGTGARVLRHGASLRRERQRHPASGSGPTSVSCPTRRSLRPMASWRQVEAEAPELAARARELFDANKHKTLATLRRDGSPRISGSEIIFADGELWFGSMWQARQGARPAARSALRPPQRLRRRRLPGATRRSRGGSRR